MGTNFYRIPTEAEMQKRHAKLTERISDLSFGASSVGKEFRFIENPNDEWSPLNPWDEFTQGMEIHLGKRSGGWKFCWNFNDNEFYHDKESLLEFIRSGRVIDEYGSEHDAEEFIQMALDWGQPDGLTADKDYFDKNPHRFISDPSKYYDREVDGLRVSSSTEFS